MITGDIYTTGDALRVVAAMMRHHHTCSGHPEWVEIADRIEAVATDPAPCPVLRDDALRAALVFLADQEPAEVAA